MSTSSLPNMKQTLLNQQYSKKKIQFIINARKHSLLLAQVLLIFIWYSREGNLTP